MDFEPFGVAYGYVRHEPSIAALKASVAIACADGPGISGACKKAIGEGIHYHNLTAYSADFIRRGGFVSSQRKIIDCGPDGMVLEPLGQQTGICDGCSFGEAALVAWAARYVASGAGPRPRECSFLWPYLGGRDMTIVGRGDSGAIPPASAQLYYSVGAMPVDCSGAWNLQSLPPHGPGSQEALCVQMRDDPRMKEHADACAPYKANVYSPEDAWDVADCLETLRPVTFGASVQNRETQPGGNGVSSIYRLNGGHETFASGWFTLNSRLGFIKTESWWNVLFPASQWPGNRVTIQTDDGPKKLYPGQGALWADEWMSYQPETWAIDAPGTR